jgi:hydrogenase expression/formation protein HypD
MILAKKQKKDPLKIAEENPDLKVIFLGVGFETTAPTVAATALEARDRGLKNFFIFSSIHKSPAKQILSQFSSQQEPYFLLSSMVLWNHNNKTNYCRITGPKDPTLIRSTIIH